MLQEIKRQVNISLVLLACIFTLGVAPCFAQNMADLARQERKRQNNISPTAQHIYTNEDFERSKILLPEDRKKFQANHKIPESLTEPQPSVQTTSATHQKQNPLGDVARRHRMRERLQQIEHANKNDVLPGTKSTLAEPTITRPEIVSIPKPHLKQIRRAKLPEPVDDITVGKANRIRINKGDTLWMMAERYLGSGTQWQKILAANPQLKDPNLIRAGEWLSLPLGNNALSGGKVRVQKGDTLWKLAQLNFGNGLAWSCIAQANPSIPNVNRIYSGQVLVLPARCATIR
jgi:nucleoid-associated protein YgaU